MDETFHQTDPDGNRSPVPRPPNCGSSKVLPAFTPWNYKIRPTGYTNSKPARISLRRCTHCPQTLDAGPRWAVSFPTSCEMCHTRTIGPNTLSTSQTISTLHTPDADGLVVASRCHHVRVARVPRNSVNGARMARKHLRASWTRFSGLYVHEARTITTRSRSGRMAVNAHLEQRGIMTVPDVDLRVLATTDDERLVAPGPWGVRDAQDHNVLRPSFPPTPPPLALWQCARTPGRPLTRRRQSE